MSRLATPVLLRAVLLVAILGGFAVCKSSFRHPLGRASADGNYYYQIARHVQEGDGLWTSVSLYYQGLKELPHRVNQNPMWPLLLGMTARVFGLSASAEGLPETLYFVDLVLLYFLGNRLWRRFGDPPRGLLFRENRILNFGHVAVFAFGVNHIFFRYTSIPYTEGLAFGILFAALICVDRAAEGRSLRWAGAAGLLAVLAFLARAQMMPVAIAIPMALATAGFSERRFFRLAGMALAGVLVGLLPWVIYLATWVDSLTPSVVLGLATLRETPEIMRFDSSVVTRTFWEFVVDRAGGFLVAFSPTHKWSYASTFRATTFLVPLAAVVLAVQLVVRRTHPRDWGSPERVVIAAVLLSGLGMLLPVHLSHNWFFKDWLFSHRHGLPLILLILPAIAYLDSRRSLLVRAVAASILVGGLVSAVFSLQGLMNRHFPGGLDRNELDLVLWLDGQDPPPTVLTTQAQRYSVFSRASYHWMHCKIGAEQTKRLLQHTQADYLLIVKDDLGCEMIRSLKNKTRLVKTFGHSDPKLAVFALRDRLRPKRAPTRSR